MHNLCTFLEDLFIIGIEDNLDTKYDFKIYKRTTKEIDPNCPTVYYAEGKVK